MPRQSLRRRFGEEFLKRLDQALGYEEEFIQPVETPEPFEERLPCIEPITHLPELKLHCKSCWVQYAKNSRRNKKDCVPQSLKGFMADGRIESIEISTSHHQTILSISSNCLNSNFQTINPEAGIEVFLLEAKKVEDVVAVQEKLWNISQIVSNKDLSELLDRLTAKYGEGHVKRFVPDEHYWPERSFKVAEDLDEPVTNGWNVPSPRPVHLLEHPEPIEVTAPIPDYPPMNFRHKGILHKIINADGPERIEQEWWLKEGQHRDYYYVEDEEGKRYWLFRLGHYDADKSYGWFLHGYFA